MPYQRMIDTESTGLGHNAIILTAGIVDFDLVSRTVLDVTLVRLNRAEQYERGAVIELGTMEFWATHPEVFQKQMRTDGMLQPMGRLCDVLARPGASEGIPRILPQYYWMRNKNHDKPMIEWALAKAGYVAPWRYNQVRDIYEYESLVTDGLVNGFQDILQTNLDVLVQRHGYVRDLKHDALNDALHQVASLFAVWDIFGFGELK